MEFRVFETITYDQQRIKAGSNVISYFKESDVDEESVTTYTEAKVIKWLFEHKEFKKLFIGKFFQFPEQVLIKFGVISPFTNQNQKPGDIDLFLVDPSQPQTSIAFEVKRVKVVAKTDEISIINGSRQLSNAIFQANKYQSLGFYQSYLMVIILNDARRKTTPNVMLRRANTEDVERVYRLHWEQRLHPDLGIIYVDINQITGRSIEQTGHLGLCIDKVAGRLEQTHDFTKKVIQVIKGY